MAYFVVRRRITRIRVEEKLSVSVSIVLNLNVAVVYASQVGEVVLQTGGEARLAMVAVVLDLLVDRVPVEHAHNASHAKWHENESDQSLHEA